MELRTPTQERLGEEDVGARRQRSVARAGVQVVEDHSWGLTDTQVLRLRHADTDYTLKSFGPRNHHFERELRGHREFTAPLLPDSRVPRLVRAHEDARLLLAVAVLAAICIGTIAVMTAPGPSF